jgi:hypothetical protein
MDRLRVTFWLTLGLSLLYLAAGVAESYRAVTSGDGGLWFWLGTLIGGGGLILAGLVVPARHPHVGRTLICVGSMMGVLATTWTIVVPLVAVTVVVLNLQKPMSV